MYKLQSIKMQGARFSVYLAYKIILSYCVSLYKTLYFCIVKMLNNNITLPLFLIQQYSQKRKH